MRILYHSAAPWVNTGYGRCTREIATHLHNEGHEVAIQCLASVSKGDLMWHGEDVVRDLESPIKVYPSSGTFGLGDVEEHFRDFKADIIFTHFDTWMEPARKKIPSYGFPYVSYVIVDHNPAPEAVVDQVLNAHETVCMSEYAEDKLQQRGVRPKFIPHGVNTDLYRPLEDEHQPSEIMAQDQEGKKRTVDLDETFMVGMVAANHGNRKFIPGQMEAFKMFLDKVDEDALLYIHTEQNAKAGYSLNHVRREIGIPKSNIIWPSPEEYQNTEDEVLNAWYNAFDVMLNCSMGESWGLTITEAQAAGTPCIVTDFSSMPEQLGADQEEMEYENISVPSVKEYPHGLAVEPATGLFMEKVSAKQYIPKPITIYMALKKYYEEPGLREEHGRKAREHVVNNYDWDREVLPQFTEMFDRLEGMING